MKEENNLEIPKHIEEQIITKRKVPEVACAIAKLEYGILVIFLNKLFNIVRLCPAIY